LKALPPLLLALAACQSHAFGPRRTTLPDGGAMLPAELVQGVWFARVDVGGAALPFLLDTGTDRTLLDEPLADRLGLEATRGAALTTATGHSLPIRLRAPLDRLRCGDAEFTGVDVASVDLGPLRANAGLEVAGILGCDLFRHCLLELDYARRRARVLPRASAPSSGGHAFDGRVPMVTATLAGAEHRLLLDTGFQQGLALPYDTVLPWRRPPRPAGELATLDGTRPMATARVAGLLQVGDLRWNDPRVVLAEGGPKLGALLLRDCLLLLDAGGGRVWLERRR
jgi:hypothetical protein